LKSDFPASETIGQAPGWRRFLLLGLAYAAASAALGASITEIGRNDMHLSEAPQTGLVATATFLIGGVAMVFWGYRSDQRHEHRNRYAAFGLGMASVALLASAAFRDNYLLELPSLAISIIGVYTFLPAFWALLSSLAMGRGLAVAIAIVSSTGSLFGFLSSMPLRLIYSGTLVSTMLSTIGGAMAVMSWIVLRTDMSSRQLRGVDRRYDANLGGFRRLDRDLHP
jgi:MFS family permease